MPAKCRCGKKIAGILNSIIALRTYTAFDTPVTIEEERRFIRDFPSRGIFHVAVDSTTDQIVGFQDVSPFADFTHAFDHVGVIGTYVALDRHRQGIAARLFDATFDAARRKGYEKIFSYVRADNDAGLRTYLGQGFRIVGHGGTSRKNRRPVHRRNRDRKAPHRA